MRSFVIALKVFCHQEVIMNGYIGTPTYLLDSIPEYTLHINAITVSDSTFNASVYILMP